MILGISVAVTTVAVASGVVWTVRARTEPATLVDVIPGTPHGPALGFTAPALTRPVGASPRRPSPPVAPLVGFLADTPRGGAVPARHPKAPAPVAAVAVPRAPRAAVLPTAAPRRPHPTRTPPARTLPVRTLPARTVPAGPAPVASYAQDPLSAQGKIRLPGAGTSDEPFRFSGLG